MCILKNLFKLNIKQLTLYLCYFMLSFTAFSLNRNSEKIGTYLYGVTIDDSWDYNSTNISKIVKALKNMPENLLQELLCPMMFLLKNIGIYLKK